MLGAGAWGWPREMLWGGRYEGGSCLGTHVRIKDFKIKKNKKLKKNTEFYSSTRKISKHFGFKLVKFWFEYLGSWSSWVSSVKTTTKHEST